MSAEDEQNSVRRELIERLRTLEGSESPSGMAELAYRRAREALEQASEEARAIRLQAMEDARLTREREMSALLESLRSLRQSAESQVEMVLRKAELEAERIRDEAQIEARGRLSQATSEAARMKDEAQAIRSSAEQRSSEVQRLEAEFNELLTEVATRLGITEKPSKGWLRRSAGRSP